jgi:hypothetical protein
MSDFVTSAENPTVKRRWRDMGVGSDGQRSYAEVVSGGFSGFTASASFLPVAAVYGPGDIIAAPQEFAFVFADGTPIPAGSIIRVTTTIMKTDAAAVVASEGAYSLALYNVTPPSNQADNALWTLASGDLPAYCDTFSLGNPVDLGGACFVKATGVDRDIKLAGSNLFGQLITVAGFTIPAVARQVTLHGFIL